MLEGDPVDILPVPSNLIRFDECGVIVRLTGAGLVAPRQYYPLEPGRAYLVEFAVQRRVNASDPSNDALRCGIAWYGQGRGRLTMTDATTVVRDLVDITVGAGRQTVRAVVSRDAGPMVDLVAPASARYCRPYVETFGAAAQSDVEVISWRDITEAKVYAPNVAALASRIAALEGLDLGERLSAVEAAVSAPNTLRFPSRAAAAVASIPVTVDVIETQGYATPGDGGAGCYLRAGSQPAHAGKVQSADGAWWELIPVGRHRIEQFGPVSSLVDCTATFGAAFGYLKAMGGGTALLGARRYLCTGTIRRSSGGISLEGIDPNSTLLDLGAGTADCLVNQSLDGSPIYNFKTSNMRLYAGERTGGHVFVRHYTAYDDIEDVIIDHPWNGILDYQINTNAWRRVTINGARGTYAGKFDSPTDHISSALTIEDSTIQGLYAGADGFHWDGWATTLRIRNSAFLSCRVCFTVLNTRQSSSAYPSYGYIQALETDGAQINSVLILGGFDINFTACDLSNTSGAAGQGEADKNCVEILPDLGHSYTRSITFNGCKIGNARERAMLINARSVLVNDCMVSNASKIGINQFPVIEILDDAQDVSITGGKAGSVFGEPNLSSFGIVIGAGAQRTLVKGVNLVGNATGGLFNNRPDDLDTVVEGCIGHRTRASGKVTIPAGQTSVIVNHGLAETPRHAFATPEQILSSAAALYCTISFGSLLIGFGSPQENDVSICWTAGLYASS